jgi:hypothetical protein
MDKFREPSNSVCYTPSSEPYRIYKIIGVYSGTHTKHISIYPVGKMQISLLLEYAHEIWTDETPYWKDTGKK